MNVILDTNILILYNKFSFDLISELTFLNLTPVIISNSLFQIKKNLKKIDVKMLLKKATFIDTSSKRPLDEIFFQYNNKEYGLCSLDRKLLRNAKKKGFLTMTISRNSRLIVY